MQNEPTTSKWTNNIFKLKTFFGRDVTLGKWKLTDIFTKFGSKIGIIHLPVIKHLLLFFQIYIKFAHLKEDTLLFLIHIYFQCSVLNKYWIIRLHVELCLGTFFAECIICLYLRILKLTCPNNTYWYPNSAWAVQLKVSAAENLICLIFRVFPHKRVSFLQPLTLEGDGAS